MNDHINRQAAIDALNEIINKFEQILRDIRESKVDDSVCGLCEYDGAYIGQSGNWCNECPGFDKDDCFKLSDEYRKRWLESVDLSSVEVELVKHGGWIIRDNPGTGWYRVTCSECGEDVTSVVPVIGFFPDAKVVWDYCPNCGAKMETEE